MTPLRDVLKNEKRRSLFFDRAISHVFDARDQLVKVSRFALPRRVAFWSLAQDSHWMDGNFDMRRWHFSLVE